MEEQGHKEMVSVFTSLASQYEVALNTEVESERKSENGGYLDVGTSRASLEIDEEMFEASMSQG